MLFFGVSAFTPFIADAFAVFIFILWFWLSITTASDLFRRKDISDEEYYRLRARLMALGRWLIGANLLLTSP